MFPLPLHIYFELASLAVGLLTWKWLSQTHLKWFLPFLSFIVLAELTGRYLSRELHQPNAWLYNFVVPIEYLFYSFIFYLFYSSEWRRKAALFFFILFTCFATGTLIIRGLYEFETRFLLAGSFFMILLCILYFADIYLSEREESLLRNPMFYVAAGLLLFNAGEFSANLFAEFYGKLDPGYKLFRDINNKLILVLYISFAIAFICQRITATYRKA